MTKIAVAVLCICCVLFASCGQSARDEWTPTEQNASSSPVGLSVILSDIHAHPTPQSADPATCGYLKEKLIAELVANQLSKAGNRIASRAPSGKAGRVADLAYDTGSTLLSWSYVNIGDYDLNGEVGVSDITPVALHFLAKTSDGAGNDALEAWIDGDANGEVGVSDITPIAVNYLSDVSAFKFLSSDVITGPYLPFGGSVSFGAGGVFPKVFSVRLPAGGGRYVTVSALGSDSSEGEPGNVIDSTGAPVPKKLLPPSSGIYLSAFPFFGNNEDEVTAQKITDYEQLAGKKIVWAYFSNNWVGGIAFPKAAVDTIHASGRVPFIRMMARSTFDPGGPDPVYAMQNIIDGDFDAQLHQWAINAKATGFPLLVEFGTEVNGEWFPWNGTWNGGATTTGFGDPAKPDGPERFVAAYRHIVDIFRSENVDNVTWFYHPDAFSNPDVPWNSIDAYYPGDDYVDWIGISCYGALIPQDDWVSFTDLLDPAWPGINALAPDKPLALLEFGVLEAPDLSKKAAWITGAFDAVKAGRYPRIKAMSWWHERWENSDATFSDLRIDSSPPALAAYRAEAADPVFITEPVFTRE